MNSNKLKELVKNDPDFIAIKRFNFSLKELLKRYEDGAPTRLIAQALAMTEEEVGELYQELLEKLRAKLE
jgi:hypothetical protein